MSATVPAPLLKRTVPPLVTGAVAPLVREMRNTVTPSRMTHWPWLRNVVVNDVVVPNWLVVFVSSTMPRGEMMYPKSDVKVRLLPVAPRITLLVPLPATALPASRKSTAVPVKAPVTTSVVSAAARRLVMRAWSLDPGTPAGVQLLLAFQLNVEPPA